MERKPRVLIAMPATDFTHTTFCAYLFQILAATKTADVDLCFHMGSVIHSLRNGLVEQILKEKFDYAFFLDTDIVGPADIIDRLLAHQKDIVGCLYRQRRAPYALLGRPLPDQIFEVDKVSRAARLPGGCILIKAEVFNKIEKPWFEFSWPNGGTEVSEDYMFCDKVTAAGVEIWADLPLSLELGHLAVQAVLTKTNYEGARARAASRGVDIDAS